MAKLCAECGKAPLACTCELPGEVFEVSPSQRRWAVRLAKDCVKRAETEVGGATTLVSPRIIEALAHSYALGVIDQMEPTRYAGQAQALIEEVRNLINGSR